MLFVNNRIVEVLDRRQLVDVRPVEIVHIEIVPFDLFDARLIDGALDFAA
jgi:hypothetical protein